MIIYDFFYLSNKSIIFLRGEMMNLDKLLKEKKIRVTKQRKLILETLKESKNPISAEEIYEIMKKNIDVDLSTVYRNLSKLEEKDILLKTTNVDSISYYQLNNKEHKHFITCNICHKRFLLEECPVHFLEERIEEETGFLITGHNFEFSGICPDCQKSEVKR